MNAIQIHGSFFWFKSFQDNGKYIIQPMQFPSYFAVMDDFGNLIWVD